MYLLIKGGEAGVLNRTRWTIGRQAEKSRVVLVFIVCPFPSSSV